MSRDTALVSADWAEKNLGTDGIVFVEVDEDTAAYDRGHLAGAIKLDWRTDLQDPVRRDFLNKSQFEALLSERGIANDDIVVLYGGNNNWFAAYAYWYFKLYGHRDVKLIDGGRKKWELDARPLTDEIVTRPATQYVASEPDLSIRAFRDEVVEAIGAKALVDVRSPDEFAGRLLAPAHLPQEAAQRGGHIPTASTCRGPRPPTRTAPSSPTTSCGQLYAAAGLDEQQGHHRLLPHRRALLAHLVRPAGAARPHQRQELRRFVDRVRLAHRRADRPRRRARGGVSMAAVNVSGCAAPDQAAPLPAGIDLEKETVITGVVSATTGETVAGAYVRLLDSTGEFTAEVVTSPEGQFRFFAAPGDWTLRALSRHGNGDTAVSAERGLNQIGVTVG